MAFILPSFIVPMLSPLGSVDFGTLLLSSAFNSEARSSNASSTGVTFEVHSQFKILHSVLIYQFVLSFGDGRGRERRGKI